MDEPTDRQPRAEDWPSHGCCLDPWLDHLVGQQVPAVRLTSSAGGKVELASLASNLCVLYFYCGLYPGRESGPWAVAERSQHVGFSELAPQFQTFGVEVAGVSADSPVLQRRVANRSALRHALLSDDDLWLARLLGLPTFEVALGLPHYERLTLVAQHGRIVGVFHPIATPAQDARDTLTWLLDEGLCRYQGQRGPLSDWRLAGS